MAAVILLLAVVGLLSTSGLALNDRTASFYGGYHLETVPHTEQGNTSLQFSFRTLQDSGVILITRLNSSSTDYVAVLLEGGNKLKILLRQNESVFTLESEMFTLDESTSDSEGWQHFQFHLHSRMLTAKLKYIAFLNYTFREPIGILSVYFGGPKSFFDPLYIDFPVAHYYVGCLANISLNDRDISPDFMSYGIRRGCCLAPRYPVWCVDSSLTNLTVTSPPINSNAHLLTVSYRLQSRSDTDGLVMLVRTPSGNWTLSLIAGRLQLVVNTSGHTKTLLCPGEFTMLEQWRQVKISLTSDNMSCIVDSIPSTISLNSALTGKYFPFTLQLGGITSSDIDNYPHLVNGTFVGCFQRLRFNGFDLDPSLLTSVEDAVSAIQPPPIQWSNLTYNQTDLVVNQGTTETISTDNILLQFPHDIFGDDSTALYQHEMERAIHFEVLTGLNYGQLFLGHPSVRVQRFNYQNILSDDPIHQVGYFHNGQESYTDVVVFRVWVSCADTVLAELFQLVLIISIEQRDDVPRITHSKTLKLAVGSRRVITPQVLTVVDPTISNPELILFSVHFIAVESGECLSCQVGKCGDCELDQRGAVIKNGVSVMFFNQDEINRGLISFQHFEKFSITPVIIRLGVTVQGSANGRLDTSVLVSLHQGKLMLTSNLETCLFVVEEGKAFLERYHLNAITDFEEQNPVITYDLLTLPLYGVIQRYEAIISQWVELSNSSSPRTSLTGGTTSFTQADINNHRVRYLQSRPQRLYNLESFQFRLRSYNFSGPVDELCINIVPYEYLIRPSITVDIAELVVEEGGSAPITHNVLNVSVNDVDYLTMVSNVEIDVEELGVVYTLVEAPSFGSVELHGQILVAGDNFTHSDITSGSLIYIHGGSENHLDHLLFYAEASTTGNLPIKAPNRTSNTTLLINITAVNDNPPEFTTLEAIRPPEGCWVPVTVANINVTDIDQPKLPLKIHLKKRRTENPNGMFALRSNPTDPIGRFFMQDILDNKVIFVHQNISSPLSYSQVLRISDSRHSIKKTINIMAVPLVLNVSVSLPPSHCIITIDADNDSLRAHLNPSLFSASLSDHFGNNPNLVAGIAVSITKLPKHGHIFKVTSDSHGNETRAPTSEFFFRDLGNLIYILEENCRNQSGDQLEMEFVYGHSVPVIHSLEICIQPQLLPLSLRVSPLVIHGLMGHVNTTHIMVTSSRDDQKDSLVFHILRPPWYGMLYREEDVYPHTLSQFTHGELYRSAVIYQHFENNSEVDDNVVLRVCSVYNCLDQETLAISIHPINLSINYTRVRILEGGIHKFSVNDFNVLAPRDYFVTFSILKGPRYGKILLETPTGTYEARYFSADDVRLDRVFYNNTILENLHDSFEMTVDAQKPGISDKLRENFIMRIDFQPVNNHAPEIAGNDNLTVIKGGSALIPSSVLNAHDYDVGSNDNDLRWSIPSFLPIAGYLFLDGDTGMAIFNWTERDIRNNRLYYRNTVTYIETDFILFNVSDGMKDSTAIRLITIVAVNIKKGRNTEAFSLNEGQSKRITYQHLRYYADNDNSLNDIDFVIKIVSIPRYGNLTLDDRLLSSNDLFTQNMIATSLLVYNHDDSNNHTDNFTFTIIVPTRQNHSINEKFDISIIAVDDDPPVATILRPLFAIELECVNITNRELLITDINSQGVRDDDKIVCQLVQPLMHGRLERWRFGRQDNHTKKFSKFDLDKVHLCYRQLTSHQQSDELVFNVTDGINIQPEIYHLNIIILPRVVPLELDRLIVTEDDMARITDEEIKIPHRYLNGLKGVIQLINGSEPRHGELIHSDTGERIRSFTTDDMHNRSVIYQHSGDESLVDSFQFDYQVLNHFGYDRKSEVHTFVIDVTPVNDQPPIIANNETKLRLWATETVVLNGKYLNVTDHDTIPAKINFTIQIKELGGFIAYTNDSTLIHWFTLADILIQRVVFVHENGPRGVMAYNVTDGIHTESGEVVIIADRLTLECDTNQWRAIKVKFLGALTLHAQNLHCTTTDDMNPDREVYYQITNPRFGHFEVNYQVRSKFNSTEVNLGLVRFVHTDTEYWRESVRIFVSAFAPPASPENNLSLVIDISYPQPTGNSSLAINRQVNVSEGGQLCFNQSILDGRNLRYRAWLELNTDKTSPHQLMIVYAITNQPLHGIISLKGTSNHLVSFTQSELAEGTICYVHDDSESLREEVLLDVFIKFANGTSLPGQFEELLSITILPQNDLNPNLTTTTLKKNLVENITSVLLTEDLEVTDGDSSPTDISFLLLSTPNNTQLLLNGSPLTVNSYFTQEDISSMKITLVPFRVGTESFLFSFSDGRHVNGNSSYKYTLAVHEQTLHLVHNNDITYFQNNKDGTIITQYHLNTSSNAPRSHTHFVVELPPCCGQIKHTDGDHELHVFTQKDIDDSLVMYVPRPQKGSGKYTDSFSLNVTNNNLTLPLLEMTVTILAFGKSNENSSISFNHDANELVQPLPPDILLLDELEREINHPPNITLLEKPKYGHLEYRVTVANSPIAVKRSANTEFTFRYDELHEGWIVYVWDFLQPLTERTVKDRFTVLVTAKGVQPGKAIITLTITLPLGLTHPPPTLLTTPSLGSTTLNVEATATTFTNSGFPVYTLVPIIGVIVFLLILIIIVVVFCLTQQKHIKNKNMSQTHHASPWSASPPFPPPQSMHYELDPSGSNPGAGDNHDSETSSGFSELDGSPRQSPIPCNSYSYSYPSASPVNRRSLPHSRVRSNVSITFSSRQSAASEMSTEADPSLCAYSLPRYPVSETVPPFQVRPSSHMAFTGHPTILADSGITSLTNTIRTSPVHNHSQEEFATGEEKPVPSAAKPSDHIHTLGKGLFDWSEGKVLPDLNDPNIQRLFHAHHPVLKKEEYWL